MDMDEYLTGLATEIRQSAKNLKDRARALHVEAVHLAMIADEIEMKLEASQEQELVAEAPPVFGQTGGSK